MTKPDDRQRILIQTRNLKMAQSAHAHVRGSTVKFYEWLVTGAKALSPNLGQRMLATRLLDRAVVVRKLMPQDLKIEINRLSREEAMCLALYLAGVVGRAHGRQLKPSQRRIWLSNLAKNHKASLEAPSWLWASVVELLTLHATAYLDHCRRHALSEAA